MLSMHRSPAAETLNQASVRIRALADVAKKRRDDPQFAKLCDENPRQALINAAHPETVKLPEPPAQIVLLADEPDALHFVLPLNPNAELKDHQLAESQIVAADTAGTAGSLSTAGTASTIPTCFGTFGSIYCAGSAGSAS